ncbi:hypothetical protein DAI22_03g142200 [Oryza sativa Japonica Group]|nr:hypothetical protein DAI22_03g142200 [Oryza sativa Japonica Group]
MATRRRAAAPPQPPAWTPEPWSDGETSALLDAWGPRHIRAAGGPLRTADWRACAAAVTARRAAAGRAPRTVDQCKNRLDYLKKRLKAERSRSKGPRPRRRRRPRSIASARSSASPPPFPPDSLPAAAPCQRWERRSRRRKRRRRSPSRLLCPVPGRRCRSGRGRRWRCYR